MQEEGISVYKREAFPKPLSKYIPFKSIQKDFTLKKSGRALESKKYKFLDKKNYRGCARETLNFFWCIQYVGSVFWFCIYYYLQQIKKYIYGLPKYYGEQRKTLYKQMLAEL